MVSVCLRSDNVIEAFNPNDMGWNTGWKYVQGEMPENTTDEYGVPLYKLVDDVITERTPEEREAERPQPEPPTPDIETRVTAVETDTEKLMANLDYLAMMTDVEIPTESEV